MIDFLMVATRSTQRGSIEIYPKFIIKKSSDLMIRGGDFYAIWIEELGLWSTDEQDVIRLVDRELDNYAEEYRQRFVDCSVRVLHMWDAETGMIDRWHKYCQKQMRDNFQMLDEALIFSNTETCKTDYASKKLKYPLESGDCSSYERLISTLYNPEERHKLEWAIGAVVSGDSKRLQKFIVLYGEGGTGKSTILNILEQLFDGYSAVFDAKALGSSSNTFALEAFKSNPLVAIQHDGDLSKIEDNTRLNSLVSHELMTVNEKFKSTYSNRFKSFLFMGTNKPVKITDSRSGLIRRLIDVYPSGNLVPENEYNQIMNHIKFELGAIAWHCKEVYLSNPNAYSKYKPMGMMAASNDLYNFVADYYYEFKKEDATTLKSAWEMYNHYCEDTRVPYPLSQRGFKEELKTYFSEYKDRFVTKDGTRVRSYYFGFRTEHFDYEIPEKKEDKKEEIKPKSWLEFNCTESIFDKECYEYQAQLASSEGTPAQAWDYVTTKLSDIDTSQVHYVRVPECHIVIDFDIPDESGNKCFEKNFEAASLWPKTYAELSKSGAGIHLHYIYTGDNPAELSRVFGPHIEIKVFIGKSALRRKLSKCNDLPISKISSGLPLKGAKMVNFDAVKSEKGLRSLIQRNLEKEIHPSTKSSIDFIHKILQETYESGLKYDVTDMYGGVMAFAMHSTNNAQYCLNLVSKMQFKSDEPSDNVVSKIDKLVFFDLEVFPNLLLVNWKIQGKGKPVIRMINPTPEEIEELLKFRLVGFNCRGYDNHILYARLMKYDNEQLYNLSKRLVSKDKKISRAAKFSEAFNISYTDIYDFASAGNKKSLKKLEIEMGIHHQELGLPWDEPVPKEKWIHVAEYCDNDVIATEAAFEYLSADWIARQILADLAGMTENDTTNTLTQRIIFDNERNPQDEFNYRNLAEPVYDLDEETYDFLAEACPDMMQQTHGEAGSLLPYFPGYEFDGKISTYRGIEIGEGGIVIADPSMWEWVALLDVVSMHPHSAIAEVIFGVRFTRRFKEIVDGRVDIKHEAWEEVNEILGGKLTKHIQRVVNGELSSKDLANGLKTAINAVYGQTCASYDNPFRDERNVDNIIAKRGALFMADLKHEVEARGFIVAHIKTDSIKIPDATPEIIEFVMEFGKKYGYEFEHEATYERMCLVNDAVYIAKYAAAEQCQKYYGYVPGENKKHPGEWTATGTQFAVPYVFKTLFSKEPIDYNDLCETKSVQSALYLDMNEDLPDVTGYEKEISKLESRLKRKELTSIEQKTIRAKIQELTELLPMGHSYHFIGRVGQFCPIKEGCGGGVLLREQDGKYYSATGAKGYRWLESELVRQLGKWEDVDLSYYNKLVNDAVAAISLYGNFEWFVSDDPYVPPEYIDGKPVYETVLPFN